MYRFSKRILDVTVATVGLAATSPFLLGAALMIKFGSRGPIFHRAIRVGQGGKPFKMLKFRTMVVGAEKIGPAVTAENDPRITPIGHLLRKSKIDEIPQLWNVLRGDMSLVGPRPNDARLIDKIPEDQRDFLSVPQGITDFASLWFRQQESVLGQSDDADADYERLVAPTKTRLANYYAMNPSLTQDLRILWATFTAVFLRKDPSWCLPQISEVVDSSETELIAA